MEFKFWKKLFSFHIELIPLGKIWIQLLFFQLKIDSITQSAGAVEYTDCTSAEG